MENGITNLVLLHSNGEPRASTEAIAKGYGAQHRSLLQLLRKYADKFESFGFIAFEMRSKAPGVRGGKDTEYAMLNKDQAMLMLTLMRNTATVIDFKVRLIGEFSSMSAALGNRDMTMWDRRLKFEAKEQKSVAMASIGSKLMSKRKKEIKPLREERMLLDAEMQPGLLFN